MNLPGIRLTIIAVLLFISSIAKAQDENRSYLNPAANDSLRAKSLSVQLLNNNFLKNNEYFGNFTEGITYIGSILQPEITYTFSKNASLTAGWFVKYYYGLGKVNRSLPVIRFDYRFMPGGRLVFGQLPGQLDHQLIEPIYSFDNYFKKNPENGIQLLVDKFGIKADIWLDWEHFLLPGDDAQEQITSGINIMYKFVDKQPFTAAAGLQATMHHHGGQVDISDAPLQTRTNITPGISLDYATGGKIVSGSNVSAWLVQALDLSPTPTLPYSQGYGIYTTAAAENRWATIMAAWWHGKCYFSPLGDYLFQSVSELDSHYVAKTRDLLNMKLLLNHEIAPGVKAGLRFESYYDLRGRRLDFCYGMNIIAHAGWGRKSAR